MFSRSIKDRSSLFTRKIKWYRIGVKSELLVEISPNKPKAYSIAGKNIILCKTEHGELTALIDKCPHQGKRLSDGWCEENKVVCPYHRYSFDLKTGLGSGTGIDVFPLSEREDGLYVGINRWVWF